MKPTGVLVWTFVSCLALAGVAQAQSQVLQTVPNSDPTHPSGLVQGDEWGFNGAAGDDVTIRVDTRDDNGNLTSNLDPVIFLMRPDGSLAAFGDDEVACSRPPICGFACPSVRYTLDQTGRWTIVVAEFGMSGCKGGAYNANVTGAAGVQLRLDDGAFGQPGIRNQLLQPKGR